MKNKTRHVFQAVLAYFKHHLEKKCKFYSISCNFFSLINPGQGNAGQYVFIKGRNKVARNGKAILGFCIKYIKIWQILMHFPRKLIWSQIPIFLRVDAWNNETQTSCWLIHQKHCQSEASNTKFFLSGL